MSSISFMARRLRFVDNESGVVEVTARTVHGRWLIRPSAKVNKIILGALGRAQARYGVELYAFVFLSNHFHILMRVDSAHQMAAFVGYVQSKLAKELGRMHRWHEKFWGRRYHSASLADSDSERVQQARFLYILQNGCKEGLVGSPLDWPGVSTAAALHDGRDQLVGLWYDRTREHHARRRGEKTPPPSAETVRLSPLPFMRGWSRDERRQYVRNAVRDVVEQSRHRNRKNRTKPLGASNIRRQHPHERPATFTPSPAPLFHTATREEFWRMRRAREEKVAAYRRAAIRARQGRTDVRFPVGCFPPPPAFVRARAAPF